MSPMFDRARELLRTSRFALPLLFILLSLSVYTGIRTLLMIGTLGEIDLSLVNLIGVYSIGLIYDIAFESYFIIPFIVYLILVPNRIFNHKFHRLLTHLLFFSLIYGLLFTAVAEWLFWQEFGARFNFISVDYLVYRTEVTNNINESYPVPLILGALFLAAATTYFRLRKSLSRAMRHQEPLRHRLKVGVTLLAMPLISYALVDQSLHHISDNNYVNELSENGPYQFFNAFKDNTLDYDRFYVNRTAKSLDPILREEVATPNSRFVNETPFDITRQISAGGPEHKRNVILVSVESLSAKYLGAFGNNEGLTPNLDRLAREGLLFSNLYATGTRTTRGLESITLSLPPTPGRSLVKRPDNNNLFSLGYVFQQKGYETKFLYGGRGYFDNMNAFFSGNGYSIVDQSDLSDEEISFSNAWGVADEDLYRRAVKEAGRSAAEGHPFFFHIMTTSNHRPFTYPDGKIDIPSGDGRNGAVKYTDHAIGTFIEMAAKQPWFDDTLFLFVADHCAGSAGKAALPVKRYHIPFIVYSPKHVAPQHVTTLASQIDVAPTLLGLLNFSYTSQFFGKDILQMRAEEGRALIGNYQRLGLLRDNRLSYQAPLEGFHLVEDPLGTVNDHTALLDEPLVLENIAFYEGADYLLKNRINRHQ